MTTPYLRPAEVDALEGKLKIQKAPHQRLVTIDRLLSIYVFTNVERARDLLCEQQQLLKQYEHPDYTLNYHLHSANVENQLYQYDLASRHFEAAIRLVEDRGDVKQQAEVYIDYAGTCINTKRMELATELLQKAEKFLKAFPDRRLQARIICREGFMNLHYSNYSKAIELLLSADQKITSLDTDIKLKDYYFLILIHSGLGTIHEHNDDLVKSVESYLKVVKMAEMTRMRSRLSWHYLNVGNAYLALADLKNAEIYFLKAIETNEDINPYSRASAYANLGYCALKKKQYEKAMQLLEKAEHLFQQEASDDIRNLANISSWRAQVAAALGQEEEARDHFFEALEYSESINDYKQLSSTCKDIADFFADRDDHRQAYDFQVLHSKYSEQYVQEVNSRKQWELEVKYEAEKKKQEAELLRLQATKLQLKALRAQMNPHFLYNALNSIQNFITGNEITYAAKYLAKFAKLMRQSLEYSELEIISLEKEIEFLEDYLYINEKLRFGDKLRYEINVHEDIEEDILGVPTMIVQPYVENAIEHGLRTKDSGLIQLSFSLLEEDTILCIIEDNGIGRRRARELQVQDASYQNHRSRGTTITEERLRILHNSKENRVFVNTIDLVQPQSGEPAGTRVEIKIPIVDIHVK